MIYTTANNVNTTLASAIIATDLSITLSSSANLPTLPIGSVMPLTLTDAASHTLFEVVYVTGIAGATLTVQRGKEGTTALPWAVGDIASSNPTATTVSNDIPTTQIVTATKTLTLADSGLVLLDGSAGNMNVTAPLSADKAGVEFDFYRIDTSANTVALLPAGADTLSGSSVINVGPGGSVRIRADGVAEQIVLSKNPFYIKKLSAAAASISIGSLVFDKDAAIEISANIKSASGFTLQSYLAINGDNIDTNYYSSVVIDDGAVAKANTPFLAEIIQSTSVSFNITLIPSGTNTTVISTATQFVPVTATLPAGTRIVLSSVAYISSGTITSIGIRDSTGALSLDIGSTLSVRQK